MTGVGEGRRGDRERVVGRGAVRMDEEMEVGSEVLLCLTRRS